MNGTLILAFLLSAHAYCASAEPAAEIAATLDDWHDAAAKADETRYFGHFAPDGVFLGTDATERWNVEQFRAYAHPYFAKGKAWTLKARDRHVSLSPDGGTAWFDEKVDSPKYGEGRGSCVLVKLKDGWRISQYNYTVPIPNEKFSDVLKVIGQPKK
ncbi:MAG: nuclear transport factor 2 family protein [Elusimicrobia bacterium]|nr:nuclear transport factor 2 family protein [Elusimicrobiota bacterium]